MATTWRLLDTPPMTAAENMALDETLVALKGKGETPNTIRFLQFSPRSVLVGYHQSVDEEVRKQYCRDENIHINRRITGGGAIFFDENQLGWEVICEKAFFNLQIPNNKLFKTLCQPVVEALDLLGIKSFFRSRNDIEVNGRKISGTGGTDSEEAFLFQGTMLVDFDVDTMLKSLRIPIEKLKAKEIDSIKERVTCINWELGYTPPLDKIKTAIKTGFERVLGIRLVPGGLTEKEQLVFEKKRPYYQSDEWINQVKPRFRSKDVIQAAYKTKAGLVRFTLVINLPQSRLKEVYITGDFLSFPPRALYDMESKLKNVPLEREAIHEIIRAFFANGKMMIPGMRADDFLKPLDQALEKVSISKYGIPLEYCNLISVTNGAFSDVIRQKPSVLLLPYCSKFPGCDRRYQKTCELCGDCTVGPAWRLGLNKNLEVVTITSFEDLMEELFRMKKQGVSSFIGCCCQPFFTKHVNDFEKVGLPGILLDIDNSTCYDLDQAREAYAGEFESQTELNLGLLEAVLDVDVS